MTVSPPPLPEGTITLMFAEFSGATALEEMHGARFREVAALCSAALRDAIATHQGRLIKTTGDFHFFAAFVDAGAALACIGETIATIYTQLWPAAFAPYGMRVALTTGTPFSSGNDYFGPPVNRCSRLLEIAHPWQILLTRATAQEITGNPPAGLTLVDRGERRLRDVAEDTRVFEARHLALPVNRPEPPSNRAATQLPAPLTAFIGREEERMRLLHLLRHSQARFVTLLGVGGCGKTRLAIETLREIEPNYPDGVWFVPLTEPLPGEVLAAILADAIGCFRPQDTRQEGVDDARDHLIAFLRPRRCLLVLDNFDRFTAHGNLLTDLLNAAPGLQCLVTSRKLLGFPDEIEFEVPPLPAEEGERLFLDRARAVRPDLALTDANIAAIQVICTQLDCLPLALELAAPLLRGLSPPQLLSRMQQQRLDLLASARRDIDPRHQTLRRCLDWSYETLSEAERGIFALCSVFAGEFTPEAARAVCAPEGIERDVPSGLVGLREKSLLSFAANGPETRYRMLEIVHEFALEKLGALGDELLAARFRHARYYVQALEAARLRLLEHGDGGYFEFCARNRDNLRAGMIWAQNARERLLFADYVLQLSPYFIEQNQWEQFHFWSPLAERHLGEAGEWNKLAALLTYNAHLAQREGNLTAAVHDLEHVLALRARFGSPEDVCESVYNIGVLLKDQGNWEEAQARFEEALTQARELNSELIVACVLNDLGNVAFHRNDPEAALRLLTESREKHRSLGENLGVACANSDLARVLAACGDFAGAHAYLLECLQIRSAIGERYATLSALYHIARLFQEARAYSAAAPLFAFLCDALTSADGVMRQGALENLEVCHDALAEQSEPPALPVLDTLAAAIRHAQNPDHLQRTQSL